MRSLNRLARLLSCLMLFAPAFAPAQDTANANQQAMHAASEAARAALVRGPKSIPLRDQATLGLPEHYGFIPQAQAAALMRAMGNRTGGDFIGLIVPLGAERADWLVTVDYSASGYVKDDDAKHWDADKLLQSLKDGTEAANEERTQRGIPPLVVTRWIEPPSYEAASHHLVWSAEAKLKNGTDTDPTINYNTYLLGREGYLSLDLITSTSGVAADKQAAHELLAAVKFNDGKGYADFKPSTDKVAAFGLAALVAGVAAKKLGLLALLAATVVKFTKVIVIAAAGGLALVRRWLKSRGARQA